MFRLASRAQRWVKRLFDATGAYVAQWGSIGSGIGQFFTPWGVATNAAGNVYVADSGNGRVQKFACP